MGKRLIIKGADFSQNAVGDLFVEIASLTSDQNARIDTGIGGGNNNLSIEIDFLVNPDSTGMYVLGNQVSTSHRVTRIIMQALTGMRTFVNSLPATPSGTSNIPFSTNTRHHVVMDRTTTSVDGTEYSTTLDDSGTENNTNIILFHGNLTATSVKGTITIYYCKIYDNGVLVRDFVPCRVGTTGYLYDRVSGDLFGNAGTGSFTLGGDV